MYYNYNANTEPASYIEHWNPQWATFIKQLVANFGIRQRIQFMTFKAQPMLSSHPGHSACMPGDMLAIFETNRRGIIL